MYVIIKNLFNLIYINFHSIFFRFDYANFFKKFTFKEIKNLCFFMYILILFTLDYSKQETTRKQKFIDGS